MPWGVWEYLEVWTMTDPTYEGHFMFCDGCDTLHPEADLSYLTPSGTEEGFYLCPSCLRLDQKPNRTYIDDLMSQNEEDSR